MNPTGLIDRYALPHAIGGWIEPGAGRGGCTIVALLSGTEVGRATVAGEADAAHRIGFTLSFCRELPPGCIASGALTCSMTTEDAGPVPLGYWETVTSVDAMAGALATLTASKTHLGPHFAQTAVNLVGSFPGRIAPLIAARPQLVPMGGPSPGDEVGHASALHLPVGLASRDGDAIVGRNGYVFLLQGSNALLSQYRLPLDSPQVDGTSDAWVELIAGRLAAAEGRRIDLIQMIIPEKSSVFPELLPPALNIEGPTPLLAVLQRKITERGDLSSRTILGLDLLSAARRDGQVFRRVDTHLTPFGAFGLAKAVLDRQGPNLAVEPCFDRPYWRDPDIGDRFFDVALLDPALEAVAPPTDRALIEQVIPDPDKHLGRRQVWRCPGAPVKRTLVVFGNSFCEFVGYGQGCLSYWLSMWFSEYHFVWDPALDWAYVDAVKADIVLCQTIERFLGGVPSS